MEPIPKVRVPLARRVAAVEASLKRCRIDHGDGCPDCSALPRAVRGVPLRNRLRLVRFAWRTGLTNSLSIWCQESRCGKQHYVAVYAR